MFFFDDGEEFLLCAALPITYKYARGEKKINKIFSKAGF